MIYEFLGRSPQFDDSVFVAPSADIIGDVILGAESSVWFHATVRGDVNFIRIGDRTNIQDNACVHVMHQTGPTIIGSDVTIGHNAMVHGCTIQDRVLIGIHATVLDKAVVESDVIVAAGSLVPPGKRLESGFMYMGSPVRKVRPLTDQEMASIPVYASNYVSYIRAYQQKDVYKSNPWYDVHTNDEMASEAGMDIDSSEAGGRSTRGTDISGNTAPGDINRGNSTPGNTTRNKNTDAGFQPDADADADHGR